MRHGRMLRPAGHAGKMPGVRHGFRPGATIIVPTPGAAGQVSTSYTTPMPPTPKVVLEIDDNTPAGEPPFTYDVSMWSFDDDLNLATRTGAEVFREMHKAADSSRFRGYPERAAQGTVELFNAFVDA